MPASDVTPRDGSPIVALPVLLLVVVAGIAALVGISLQPSSTSGSAGPSINAVVDPSATPSIAPTPTGPCPSTAAIPTAPAPNNEAARTAWISDALNVLADRVQCTQTIDGVTTSGVGARPEFKRYTGIDLDTANGVLRVYWKGAVPSIVRERVGTVPAGLRVTFVTTARYTSDRSTALSALSPLATAASVLRRPGAATRTSRRSRAVRPGRCNSSSRGSTPARTARGSASPTRTPTARSPRAPTSVPPTSPRRSRR